MLALIKSFVPQIEFKNAFYKATREHVGFGVKK